MTRELTVHHPALHGPFRGVPPQDADLTDRQRVGVVLQAAALLAHLDKAAGTLSRGWSEASVDPEGLLAVPGATPAAGAATASGAAAGGTSAGDSASPGAEMPQEALTDLLRRLFRTRDRVAGRGEGRRAARALLEGWDQGLVAVAPDRLVGQVLDEAPFLWEPAFAEVRRRLVAVHEPALLWIAGPDRWRDRMLALAGGRRELEDLVAGDLARELWHSTRRPTRNPTRPAARQPPQRPPLAQARSLYFQGRFESCLDVLSEVPFEAGGVLRAGCHCFLGQLEAARRVLGRLERLPLEPAQRVACGEIAARVLQGLERPEIARRWIETAVEAAREAGGEIRLRAGLLAAFDAWDRGDTEAMERHLEAARPALETPELAWRWHHGAGLLGLARAEGRRAAAELGRALAVHRRGLARFEAAGLWNDLGAARGQAGDLSGAERAFRHSLRLHERCDGPRKVTLALQNLAETRLRRGRLRGVRRILERSSSTNRRTGNLRAQVHDAVLWARYELVHGRPEAALALCREALAELELRRTEAPPVELKVLEARALGWLGRSEEAAKVLVTTTPEARVALEPEEIAPLWAHAGERERALREVADGGGGEEGAGDDSAAERGTGVSTGVTARLWHRLLTARPVPAQLWRRLDTLEPFRAARALFDAELLFPGRVPADLRRRAILTFRRLGATWFAERLEARDSGPWHALAGYLLRSSGPGGDAADDADRDPDGDAAPERHRALADLFAQAGYPDVRLWWEGAERAVVVVDGAGGEHELSAPAHGGRLVLTSPVASDAGSDGGSARETGCDAGGSDAALRALFRLAVRDFVPEQTATRPPRGGMVGESETLLAALKRLESFAASDLPVLVLGESGTGKELAARQIHRRSPRAEAAFVALNCAALSETLLLSDLFGHVRGSFTGADRDRAGVFETAQGGTVFLDEIGDLPASAQGMLLRALQEGEVRRVGESLPRRVDVRVVAATHRNLEEMVEEGSFRQDLFYRLRGAAVTLPPLRDRGRDVLLLADHFLARMSPSPRLSSAARQRLLVHPWPGNVRELENVLGTAAALAPDGRIDREHLDLPQRQEPTGSYHQQVEALRRKLIREALTASGGNRSEAARRLGLTRQALSYLVRQLGLV